MFSLSDIKNIVIPCDQEQCSGEVRLRSSDDFDANRPMQCPVCHKEGFIGTFRAIRRIVRLSKDLSKWALAFYLYSTNLKGVSSMKLHRDLGITQKSAWHLAHRIRETWNDETEKMAGPVEADETYIGGKEANKHESKKLRAGRGTVGKTPVVGVKDRETNRISTEVLESADQATLQNFVIRHTEPKAQVYTDEAAAYRGIPRAHEAVSHSAKEYVRGMAHTNGMESHWAMLKRGLDGVYHHVSVKHLGRYTTEFQGRHNNRPLDTADLMGIMAANTEGKRLSYAELIGPKETRRPRML